jgi:hypothetical protein
MAPPGPARSAGGDGGYLAPFVMRRAGEQPNRLVSKDARTGFSCCKFKIRVRYAGDPRHVVSDPEARYWGGRVEERSLVPLDEARRRHIGLDEWLRRSQTKA